MIILFLNYYIIECIFINLESNFCFRGLYKFKSKFVKCFERIG